MASPVRAIMLAVLTRCSFWLLEQLGKVAVVALVLRLVPPVRARRRALWIAHGDLLPYRRARTTGQLAVELGRGAGR
jgi:hypothetical protein